MIGSPDTPLRTACTAAIATATGLPVFSDIVPKSANTPGAYVLISSVDKTRTAVAKPTVSRSDNFGWQVNITFDIIYLSPPGYSNPGIVDTAEEQIINAAENLMVDGWAVKSRVQVQSTNLNVNTVTNFINRKVLTYQYWINKL